MVSLKPRILLFGNCQGQWLAENLARSKVSDHYDIFYLANFGEWPADHPIHEEGFLASCSWVVWQTAAGQKPPELLKGLSPQCRQFRFPTLWLKMLWPTNAVDHRNKAEPGFPWGRFSNGDGVIQKLIAEGVPLEDLPKRYIDTDLNKVVNLERYRDMTLAELRYNDSQSDLAVTPLIEATFRQKRLFGTINHPTFFVLRKLFDSIVSAVMENGPTISGLSAEMDSDYIGSEEIPIHPQIVEFFQLAWPKPTMRWRFRSAFLTLPEYVMAYAANTPIPFGESPALWMARARQAGEHNDLREAQRLLLEATTKYPTLVQFLQYLGLLLLRDGQLLESEKVYRYAISRHAGVAGLHSKLGVILLKRGFKEEAQLSFVNALKIEPANEEALRHFI